MLYASGVDGEGRPYRATSTAIHDARPAERISTGNIRRTNASFTADGRRARPEVPGFEFAPWRPWDSDRLEVVGVRHQDRHAHFFTGWQACLCVPAPRRGVVGVPLARCSPFGHRESPEPVGQFPVRPVEPAVVPGIPRWSLPRARRGRLSCAAGGAGAVAAESLETADEQARRDQDHERQRDLRDRQHPVGAQAPRPRRVDVFQRGPQIESRRPPGRSEPEEQAGRRPTPPS